MYIQDTAHIYTRQDIWSPLQSTVTLEGQPQWWLWSRLCRWDTHPPHPAPLCRQPLDNAQTHPVCSDAESPAWVRGQPTPILKTRIYFWEPSWLRALGSELTWHHFWTLSGTNSKRRTPGAGKASQRHYRQSWASCYLASLGNAKFPAKEVW